MTAATQVPPSRAEVSSPGDARPDRPLGLALGLGLVTVVLGYVWRTTLVPTDPWHYVQAAVDFPAPRSSWNEVGLTRWGMILPLRALAILFGNSELTFLVIPILSSAVLVSALVLLVARFWGRWAGLAAGVLFLANSVVFSNLSRGYPDLTATALVVVAVLVAFHARDAAAELTRVRDGGELDDDGSRTYDHALASRVRTRMVLLLALVGFLLGWSYEVRETAVMGFPVVAAVLLWRGRPPIPVSLVAVGVPALAWIALEIVMDKLVYHEGFLRFRVLSGANLAGTTNPADIPYLNHSRGHYLTVIPDTMAGLVDGRWMVAMAVVAVLGGIAFPRTVGFFSAWFVLLYLFFTLVGGGLHPGAPSIRLDVVRYWIFFLAPMVAAVVGTAVEVLRRIPSASHEHLRRRRTALVAVLAVLLALGPVVAGARATKHNPTFLPNNDNGLAALRTHLADVGDSSHAVWSDWQTGRLLLVYQSSFTGSRTWHAPIKSLTGAGTPQPGDRVVVFSSTKSACLFCHDLIAPYLKDHEPLPSSWQREWSTAHDDVIVYRVTG